MATTFDVYLIKPTRYDDDGYPIQWMRPLFPSNSLACLAGILDESVARGGARFGRQGDQSSDRREQYKSGCRSHPFPPRTWRQSRARLSRRRAEQPVSARDGHRAPARWYESYGALPLLDAPLSLVLPLATAASVLERGQ
jgi:hypothetical protein